MHVRISAAHRRDKDLDRTGSSTPTVNMLARLATDAVRSPSSLEALEYDLMDRVRKNRLGVEWIASFAVPGPYDDPDTVITQDIDSVARACLLVRASWHGPTEIWPATARDRVKDLVRHLP